MKSSENDGQTLIIRLTIFLSQYHSTPHATIGSSPSELFLQRKFCFFILLKLNVASKVNDQLLQQKKCHDQHSQLRIFQKDQSVMARD